MELPPITAVISTRNRGDRIVKAVETILLNDYPDFELRIVDQSTDDVTELAEKVQRVAGTLGLRVEVRNLENPRKEMEEHYYRPDHKLLLNLGYEPSRDIEAELKVTLTDLMRYRSRIIGREEALMPDIRWDGTRRVARFLDGR